MTVGGKRNGAGRPKNSGKYGEETKSIRLPKRFVELVEQLDDESCKQVVGQVFHVVSRFIKRSQRFNPLTERAILPEHQLPKSYASTIAATVGVTSALENTSSAEPIDLHCLLVPKPSESFTVRVIGDSMNQAGIQEGDLLVVQKISDLSLQLTDGAIVVAFVDGNETVKRYNKKGNRSFLVPESSNKLHQALELKECMDVQIVGIVFYSIHPTHRSSRF
jgi:DNA polymerase V